MVCGHVQHGGFPANMAASKLTWRRYFQHDGDISNMAAIFSYMAIKKPT
jgi:hypothetical protein